MSYNEHREYELRGELYTIGEISRIISHNSGAQIENVIGYRVLSQILSRGGMPLLGRKFAKIGDLFEDSITGYYSTGTERQQARSRKKYVRKLKKITKRKHLLIHNTAFYLRDLLQGTLVNSHYYMKNDIVKVYELSDEQCVAIANNFKRDIKGKSRLPYQAATKYK